MLRTTGRKLAMKLALLLLAVMLGLAAHATGDSNAPKEYLERIFAGEVPASETIWMSGDIKESATQILGHTPDYLRLRYWRDSSRIVWIIDEIGKTEPITFGLVIADNKIVSAEVLVFRESRGWEIQHEFFTNQFNGASLKPDLGLNRAIDGISGATLSVRAMTRVSRLVLLLSASLTS